MEKKKGINFFLALIVVILGWTLYKHIDFKEFTLKDPVLDILYLVVLILCIYFIIRDYKKQPGK